MATSRPLMRASSAEAAFTMGVLGVAGLLFLHTAYRQLSMARSITGNRNAALTSDAGATVKASSSSNNATTKLTPASKTTRDSSVHVTYPATLDMCDARPPDEHAPRAPSTAAAVSAVAPSPRAAHARRSSSTGPAMAGYGGSAASSGGGETAYFVRAGALLKLVDVVAGVAARRHAGGNCVTVSVDAVLLLAPIPLGSLIYLSASVNRAWGTSMEVGVKVVKELAGIKTYVSHSYLTFVALPSPHSGAIKPKLPVLAPQTTLEARRHLLAGRRRAKRIEDAANGHARDGVPEAVKSALREEVAKLRTPDEIVGGGLDEAQISRDVGSEDKQQLERLELEFVVRAWAAWDPAVVVRDDVVEVHLPGDEPLQHSLKAVEEVAAKLKIARPSSPPEDVQDAPAGWTMMSSSVPRRRSTADAWSASPTQESGSFAPRQLPESIRAEETVRCTLHLVFPQDANSQQRLFGGHTMAWMESTAIMSARSLGFDGWSTVSMDGLEFKAKVVVGEIMTLRAVVVRTFVSSAEVYVQAHAESQDGSVRFTNDALFTLSCRPSREAGGNAANAAPLPAIEHTAGSALEAFAKPADRRRAARLEMRDMLRRLYS